MTPTRTHRTMGAVVGVVAVAALALGACSSDDKDSSASDKTTTTKAMSSSTMPASTKGAAMEPTGPECASVPTDGKGSFFGMATDPAATAASNNPLLSTLVTAVGKANLGDTLNGPGPFTIFAPVNDAFAKIPADQLAAVLANQQQLTDILTYHVVAGEKMSSKDLVEKGTATSVEGKDLTFTEDNGTLMVNGSASVVCMDVPTANATVHIIDSVLMPPA